MRFNVTLTSVGCGDLKGLEIVKFTSEENVFDKLAIEKVEDNIYQLLVSDVAKPFNQLVIRVIP